MTTSDRTLIARIATGDSAAFAEFYDRHSARVHGLLMRLLRSRARAEDVLQEVFWQVWTRAGRYDAARGEPVAWLIMMARSRALDELRARRPLPEAGADSRVDSGSVSADLERSELEQLAAACLQSLPVDQKTAIQMAFHDGYTHEEIARRLDEPLGTIKTRIRLGMQKLRQMLASPEPAT